MVTSRLLSDVDPSILAVSLDFLVNNHYELIELLAIQWISELARGAKPLIRMSGNQTFLDPPEAGSQQDTKRATERKPMAFSFDKSYWSAGPRDEPGYCSQQTLYDDLGKELLDHGFAGFNACILACELCSMSTNLNSNKTHRWTNWYDYYSLSHITYRSSSLRLGSGKSYRYVLICWISFNKLIPCS